jgi:hypothetical protein
VCTHDYLHQCSTDRPQLDHHSAATATATATATAAAAALQWRLVHRPALVNATEVCLPLLLPGATGVSCAGSGVGAAVIQPLLLLLPPLSPAAHTPHVLVLLLRVRASCCCCCIALPLAAHVFAQADEVPLSTVHAVSTGAPAGPCDAQHLGRITVTLAYSRQRPAAAETQDQHGSDQQQQSRLGCAAPHACIRASAALKIGEMTDLTPQTGSFDCFCLHTAQCLSNQTTLPQ